MDLKTYVHTQHDRVGAGACVVLGAIVLFVGWIGVSGTALAHEQVSYLVSGGLFGIALIGIGATLWLSADLRDEWRKLDRVEEALRAVTAEPLELHPQIERLADEPVVPAQPRLRKRAAAVSR